MRLTPTLGLVFLSLSASIHAQKSAPAADDETGLVREAVREAFEIVAGFEPDLEAPRVELARAAALLDGPQALPEVDALTTHAVRWGRPADALALLRISTLTDLTHIERPSRRDASRALAQLIVARWGRQYVAAMESRSWGKLLDSVWASNEPDLDPHLAALVEAVRLGDAGFAFGVAALARHHFGLLEPTPGLARDYSIVLQLRDWISEEEYQEGLAALVDRCGQLEEGDRRYLLTTARASVELTAPEFYAFELVRRGVASGRAAGLDLLGDLQSKVDSVGGWEEAGRWYRRDRLGPGPREVPGPPSPVPPDRMATAVARVQAIEPLLLRTPLEARHEVLRLAADPDTLADLLVLCAPGSPLSDEARRELVEQVGEYALDSRRADLRKVVLEWFGRSDVQTTDELAVRALLQDEFDRMLLRGLARHDLAGALGIARDQQAADRKLRFLLWSVKDWLAAWRVRPGQGDR